jgi:hypothetical protein
LGLLGRGLTPAVAVLLGGPPRNSLEREALLLGILPCRQPRAVAGGGGWGLGVTRGLVTPLRRPSDRRQSQMVVVGWGLPPAMPGALRTLQVVACPPALPHKEVLWTVLLGLLCPDLEACGGWASLRWVVSLAGWALAALAPPQATMGVWERAAAARDRWAWCLLSTATQVRMGLWK